MPYLSPRALDGMIHYKYKASGYTFLDELHTPMWEWICNRLPMWLAPNLITLTGLMCVVAAFALDAWYILDYSGARMNTGASAEMEGEGRGREGGRPRCRCMHAWRHCSNSSAHCMQVWPCLPGSTPSGR